MKRFSRVVLAGAACLAMSLGAPASAASPSQQECEAQGGTFIRERGEVQCVIVEEGKNPRFTEETTTSGQGNIGNKQEQESSCEGTGSDKCPPGQF